MAFVQGDSLYQPPSVDFGQRRAPGGRYSDGMPVPGRLFGEPSGGMGLYGAGMGAALKMNTDLPSEAAEAKKIDAAITNLLAAINQAGATYAGILSGTVQEGVLAGAKSAVSALQAIQGELQAAITAGSKEYGSYQGSTDAWNAMDSAIGKGKVALSTYDSVPSQVTSAGQAAQAARVANERAAADAATAARTNDANAAAAALRQQQADQSAVNSALTRATTFLGQRNYAGALAALQSQSVIDAATRIGRAGDLETAVAAVTDQQARANDAATALANQQAACAQQGGSWNGTFCDMTAANLARQQGLAADANAKVDQLLAQAQAQASTGNFRGALMVLSSAMTPAAQVGRTAEVQLAQADVQQQQADAAAAAKAAQSSARVDAAINQANAYAANGGFDVALSVLNGIMSEAVAAGRANDVIAAQTAIQQARTAATTGTTSGGTQNTSADLLAFQRDCINRGGLWDGTNCDMSEVRAREQAQRERDDAARAEQQKQDRLMALLSNPLFMTNPAVQQQVLAQILAAYGIDPGVTQGGGGMAQNVPGAGPAQFVANTGQYAGPFGEERF